jgi:hypothetical protein
VSGEVSATSWEIGTVYNTPGLDSLGHNWNLFIFDGEGVVAEARGQTPDQAIERARLIAAAPDLLEALRAAQSLIAVTLGEGADAIVPERVPTRLGVPVKAGAIMEQISAALSKAGA